MVRLQYTMVAQGCTWYGHKLHHGIPLFTVVYHGCTMVVPWYFSIRGHLFYIAPNRVVDPLAVTEFLDL